MTDLWHHTDFRKLWLSQTISAFGSEFTNFAIPLTAVLTLKATPAQMGLLKAAEFAPFLLIGLFAGVWVDRLRRRPILMGADLGRALLLGSIPVAATLGVLCIEYLYLTAFCVGILTVFFDVAYYAFLPSLVKPEQLNEGNSKLAASTSVAKVTGPGLAGGLVGLMTAPMVIVIDALSFFCSAVFLGLICTSEPTTVQLNQPQKSIWREIGEGLWVVWENSMLRSIVGCTSMILFWNNLLQSIYVLYLTQELHLQPTILGVIFALASSGGLVGALVAAPAMRWFGLGRTIVETPLLRAIGYLLIPLASGPLMVRVIILAIAGFLMALALNVYSVNQLSLRQAIVPDRLQGRVTASMRFIGWGSMPMGALLGGVLGETIGLRATLVVGALGTLLAFVWIFHSPVRRANASY